MAKIRYIGPRETQFGTGRCPSGETYIINPGTPVEVDSSDMEYLLGQHGSEGVPLFDVVIEVIDDTDTVIIRRTPQQGDGTE